MENDYKNILITGVAGFIGSNFAHYIAEKYPLYNIIGIDKLSDYSSRTNIASLEATGKIQFIKCDISDYSALDIVYQTQNLDYVVNFAAESHNDRAILDPSVFVKSNVVGAQNLLELSRQYDVQRHVHISTIEVYGEQATDVPYFVEGSPLNAKTPYSASKAASDMMVRAYMQTYKNMDIAITHCANNYGPYQFPEKLVPLAITNVLCGKKIPIYGDGKQMRDWLHVNDHCRGLDLVLHREATPIEEESAWLPEKLPIYDFSARQEHENIEIVRIILDELGKDFDSSVDFVHDRPNHDRRYLINPAKAENDLGFKPLISFEEGLRSTVRWYVDNQAWWQPILDSSDSLQIDWATFKV